MSDNKKALLAFGLFILACSVDSLLMGVGL